jgi:rod shape-determining protein MreD
MITRQLTFSALIFLFMYTLQESLINQVRLPGGGFSIFIIFALVWSALSTPEVGAVAGFGAGFLVDLSPSSSGPVGQWTLIMILTCFGIAFLGFGDDKSRGNPITIVFLVVAGVFLSEVAFLITGALLGVNLGSLNQIAIILIGMSLWTLLITPFTLPIFSRFHAFTFDTGSRI